MYLMVCLLTATFLGYIVRGYQLSARPQLQWLSMGDILMNNKWFNLYILYENLDHENCILFYTEYAGLEITADLAVALRKVKTKMLVPVKYWRLWEKNSFSALTGNRVYSVKIDTLFDFLGPKQNFFSLTVCS